MIHRNTQSQRYRVFTDEETSPQKKQILRIAILPLDPIQLQEQTELADFMLPALRLRFDCASPSLARRLSCRSRRRLHKGGPDLSANLIVLHASKTGETATILLVLLGSQVRRLGSQALAARRPPSF
jgi:hypothetical protein